MSQNTGICQCGISTPQIAINSSQLTNTLQYQTQWVYKSTIQGVKPNYTYQYKSQTERIQSLMGQASLRQC